MLRALLDALAQAVGADVKLIYSALSSRVVGSGTSKITVGPTAPANPSSGDIWIDTN